MENKTNLLLIYNSRKLNKTNMWLLYLFFGWHYGSISSIWLQLLFYFTLGGFGLWSFILLFFINSNVDDYNRRIALELGLNQNDLRQLGL